MGGHSLSDPCTHCSRLRSLASGYWDADGSLTVDLHGMRWSTVDVYANGCKTVRVVTHIFNIPNFTSGWGGGGVGILTFVWSWTRHWCYAEHGVGWGGVGMLTFVWSWTRHWCYAEHGVGWGGVGMLTFVWSWTRHWCYAEHGVGWGGDVNVRFEVEHAIDATLRVGWGC